ncbi:putative ferric-chelate reductase 1 homolog isoform X2 [Physella acuta]|uniref:putative ferric-chelate reductase 1 homolog isoform X2 n=1 Tax=Physella acuta TaxID=109671 RepID=UPI0027DC0D43|nr:putative ferric-chelate reductase 1 homolog isoform X2 [Physella acuta]
MLLLSTSHSRQIAECTMKSTVELLLLVLLWPTLTQAAVNPPTQCCSCDDLMPMFSPSGKFPQVMPSPFKIDFIGPNYRPDTEVRVNLLAEAGHSFRSFMLGAYTIPYKVGNKPVGQFKLLPNQDFLVKQDCSEGIVGGNRRTASVIVSQDMKPKNNLRFVWEANGNYGHVEFRATFVVDDDTFWVSEKSRLILDPLAPVPPPDSSRQRSISPISTDRCGESKGCYREPAGCIEPQCLYILTWMTYASHVSFELGGLADGSNDRYVAVGLSDDKYMGDDTVMTCAHNSANDKTEMFLSYNKQDPKSNHPIEKYVGDSQKLSYSVLLNEEGSYDNGRLRCRFNITRDLDRLRKELRPLRGGPVHLLFSRGFATRGSPNRHGLSVEELPLASAQKVDLSRMSNYFGRARYPLAKAHGCLMILAWVFFASLGMLLTKYYKPMWPNKRIFEQKYWFFGHFNCMASMFIITVIGIILIFVEADGYSEAPDLPQRAHPILGIIIFICIIINPVLALIRPQEDSKCRPVFNWFHWAFGTIANVLSIPTIFIGMDFGKVMVPWWATWILVIWVIFHIAVELSLEIHQCCTYKKNKERRKKWEQTKREYPKQHHPEPEPAGRRFKRFMLFLHIGFTALITLIMIIIIAVS